MSKSKENPDFISSKKTILREAHSPDEKAKELIYQHPNTELQPARKINYGNKTSSFLSDYILKQIPKTPNERA